MNEMPPVQTTSAQSALSSKDLMRFENEKKSAGVALFLCWVLGIFGGHRFYLRRPHAVKMLIITLISFPLCLVVIGFSNSPVLVSGSEVKLTGSWRMISANNVSASGETLSTVGYNASSWYATTVPSTVLGTLINNGVYGGDNVFVGINYKSVPGLTNQDWWYRTEFTAGAASQYG